MNYFEADLELSHLTADAPFWESLYRQAFPGFIAMHDHRNDGWWQRMGVDRSIILQCSKQILVDEKVRGKNKETGEIYNDVALEYVANDVTKAPGWVCKPLLADYIAYVIAPLGFGYLFPVLQLQEAWRRNSAEWFKRFPKIPARNAGYTTWSLGVEVNVLYAAIGQCLRCKFEAHLVEVPRETGVAAH